MKQRLYYEGTIAGTFITKLDRPMLLPAALAGAYDDWERYTCHRRAETLLRSCQKSVEALLCDNSKHPSPKSMACPAQACLVATGSGPATMY